jgi:hypothetical protein
LSQTVQFLSRLTFLVAGGGIRTGLPKVTPPSVDRLTKIVGTSRFGSSGIEEIIHVSCLAS